MRRTHVVLAVTAAAVLVSSALRAPAYEANPERIAATALVDTALGPQSRRAILTPSTP